MLACQAHRQGGFSLVLGWFVLLLLAASESNAAGPYGNPYFNGNPYIPPVRQVQKPFSHIDRNLGVNYADPFATGCARAYSASRIHRYKQTKYQQFAKGPIYKRYPSLRPVYGNPAAATVRRVASSRPGSEAYSNGLYTFPLSNQSRYATLGDSSSIQRFYPMSAGCLIHGQNGDVYRTASGYWFPLR